jgi:hypothetical protein
MNYGLYSDLNLIIYYYYILKIYLFLVERKWILFFLI